MKKLRFKRGYYAVVGILLAFAVLRFGLPALVKAEGEGGPVSVVATTGGALTVTVNESATGETIINRDMIGADMDFSKIQEISFVNNANAKVTIDSGTIAPTTGGSFTAVSIGDNFILGNSDAVKATSIEKLTIGNNVSVVGQGAAGAAAINAGSVGQITIGTDFTTNSSTGILVGATENLTIDSQTTLDENVIGNADNTSITNLTLGKGTTVITTGFSKFKVSGKITVENPVLKFEGCQFSSGKIPEADYFSAAIDRTYCGYNDSTFKHYLDLKYGDELGSRFTSISEYNDGNAYKVMYSDNVGSDSEIGQKFLNACDKSDYSWANFRKFLDINASLYVDGIDAPAVDVYQKVFVDVNNWKDYESAIKVLTITNDAIEVVPHESVWRIVAGEEILYVSFYPPHFSPYAIYAGAADTGDSGTDGGIRWSIEEKDGVMTLTLSANNASDTPGQMKEGYGSTDAIAPWMNSAQITNVKNVVLEDSVTKLARNAFYNPNQQLSFDKMIINVSDAADEADKQNKYIPQSFINGVSVDTIVVEEGIVKIVEDAFHNSKTDTFVLPASLENVTDESFLTNDGTQYLLWATAVEGYNNTLADGKTLTDVIDSINTRIGQGQGVSSPVMQQTLVDGQKALINFTDRGTTLTMKQNYFTEDWFQAQYSLGNGTAKYNLLFDKNNATEFDKFNQYCKVHPTDKDINRCVPFSFIAAPPLSDTITVYIPIPSEWQGQAATGNMHVYHLKSEAGITQLEEVPFEWGSTMQRAADNSVRYISFQVTCGDAYALYRDFDIATITPPDNNNKPQGGNTNTPANTDDNQADDNDDDYDDDDDDDDDSSNDNNTATNGGILPPGGTGTTGTNVSGGNQTAVNSGANGGNSSNGGNAQVSPVNIGTSGGGNTLDDTPKTGALDTALALIAAALLSFGAGLILIAKGKRAHM